MKNVAFSNNSTAASEVIGAVILVLIAVGAFGAIYFQLFPVPLPAPNLHVNLAGYVTDSGQVVLQHVGGEPLDCYTIRIEQSDGPHLFQFENDPWEMGEIFYLPVDENLFRQEKQVKVSVYAILTDGSTSVVFDGIITPREHQPGPGVDPLLDPMVVTTLRSRTIDEDLICYSYMIDPNINPVTYIYNWMVASAGPYSSFTRLLLPFDTENPFETKDYSGNNYNGTINGSTWTNQGKLGGAYQFDGDDFIVIPYCFENEYIDKITVEAWMKTSLDSGTILSYNRNNYCELALSDGNIKWSTNSSDGAMDITGNVVVNDNTWHLVAVTYDASLGDCAIYVDGRLDTYQHIHAVGKLLGSGDTPSGAIGKGIGVASRQTIFSTSFETQDEKNQWVEHNGTGGGQQINWSTLRYDNFNSGWGNYDYGYECFLSNYYKHEGTYAAGTKDNSGTGSAITLTSSIDVDTPGYKSIKVDFWWMWRGSGWQSYEDWWLLYYDGTAWNTILDMNYPGGYTTDMWYHTIVYINKSDYRFPTNMKIRFQCDASSNYDELYFDQIYINVTGYSRIECDFSLIPSTVVTPHSESFSLGGSGDFDPEFAAFNRTGIDISSYTDVQISIWYSYKDTESNDFLALYYRNGSQWVPIFEITNPDMAGGQKPWTHILLDIPKSIGMLCLQLKWQTSSANEYIVIDDLEITGIRLAGEINFTGTIDEVKIYPRVLSAEQLYQNYLCTQDGNSALSVIVSEELGLDETWKCQVIPNDGLFDDVQIDSNVLFILSYGGGG